MISNSRVLLIIGLLCLLTGLPGPGCHDDQSNGEDTEFEQDTSTETESDSETESDYWIDPDSGRIVYESPVGGEVETYPGNEAANYSLNELIIDFAMDDRFHELLAEITIIISPPDQGLEGIEELADEEWAEFAEGVAMAYGHAGIEGPALAITSDSILMWNLGFAHELLHLYHHLKCDAEEKQLIEQTYIDFVPPEGPPDIYMGNEYELFAYMGQWYVAGYGETIAEKGAPTATEMLDEVIGDTPRIEHGADFLSEAEVEAWIETLIEAFTGQERTVLPTPGISAMVPYPYSGG